MSDEIPVVPKEPEELPAIDFESSGPFAVHNPEPDLPQSEPWQPASQILGQTRELQRFAEPLEARAHALAMLQQARRSLCLYSPDLEPWLYNHSSIQQACTQLLLAHPRNRLRILLRDSGRAIRDGHRLLTLARRLPSNMQIRKLNPDYPSDDCAFLIADDCGLLMRPKSEQFAGYALYQDPGAARLRQAQFDQCWERALADPDLQSFLL